MTAQSRVPRTVSAVLTHAWPPTYKPYRASGKESRHLLTHYYYRRGEREREEKVTRNAIDCIKPSRACPRGAPPSAADMHWPQKKTRVTYSYVSFGSASRIGAAPTQKKVFFPLERRVAIRRAILPPPSPPGNPLMPTHSLAGRTSVKTERGTVHTHTFIETFGSNCSHLLFYRASLFYLPFPYKVRTVAVNERSRNIFSCKTRHSEHPTNRKTFFSELASYCKIPLFLSNPLRQLLLYTK